MTLFDSSIFFFYLFCSTFISLTEGDVVVCTFVRGKHDVTQRTRARMQAPRHSTAPRCISLFSLLSLLLLVHILIKTTCPHISCDCVLRAITLRTAKNNFEANYFAFRIGLNNTACQKRVVLRREISVSLCKGREQSKPTCPEVHRTFEFFVFFSPEAEIDAPRTRNTN